MSEKRHCSASLRSPRAAVLTLGCAKNSVDSDSFSAVLRSSGFELIAGEKTADVLIINTCGFIDDARRESVEVMLEAVRWKAAEPGRKVLVMGCLTQRDGSEIREEIPELDGVFGIGEWGAMLEALGQNPLSRTTDEPLTRFSGASTPGSAYLRISDGCSHGCAFCSIPQMRGLYRSEPMDALVREAELLVERGARELILIGQETTSYGVDLYRRRALVELCETLSDIEDIHWLRLMYAHPPTTPPSLMKELAQVQKLVPYIDFPIEHASERMLKLMNRRTTAARMKASIDAFREALPDACVRTTVLVGFPGETDEDFETLYRFMEEIEFERAGVFTYSPQEGTLGATLPDRVEEGIALDRLDRLMNLQKKICRRKHRSLIGDSMEVLVERTKGDHSWGRCGWDAPEIDGNVKVNDAIPPGTITRVLIDRASAYQLEGRPIDRTTASKQEAPCGISELPVLS